jgi:hypothetical protein
MAFSPRLRPLPALRLHRHNDMLHHGCNRCVGLGIEGLGRGFVRSGDGLDGPALTLPAKDRGAGVLSRRSGRRSRDVSRRWKERLDQGSQIEKLVEKAATALNERDVGIVDSEQRAETPMAAIVASVLDEAERLAGATGSRTVRPVTLDDSSA